MRNEVISTTDIVLNLILAIPVCIWAFFYVGVVGETLYFCLTCILWMFRRSFIANILFVICFIWGMYFILVEIGILSDEDKTLGLFYVFGLISLSANLKYRLSEVE